MLLVGEYMQAAIGAMIDAIKRLVLDNAEVAIVPQGAAGRGSTLYVDFHTTKPIQAVARAISTRWSRTRRNGSRVQPSFSTPIPASGSG